jgi:hypothetical protein
MDSGFEKVDERGGFEVYTDGTTPHAVGEDRHVVVLPGMGASESDAEGLMDRVLKEANQDAYEVPEAIQDGLNSLDVRDTLTIENTLQDLGYTASTQSNSLQPDYGVSSADFDEGSKYGAWPFETESKAEKAANILSRREKLMNGYESVGRKENVVTGSGPNYNIENMNKDVDMRFFLPMI